MVWSAHREDSPVAAPRGNRPGAQDSGGEAPPVIQIANVAVSTSGDNDQFVLIDGQRYSHVIDPHTGVGLTNRVSSTVIALDGITADSLSTALCVLGKERGSELLHAYPHVRAYIRRLSS